MRNSDGTTWATENFIFPTAMSGTSLRMRTTIYGLLQTLGFAAMTMKAENLQGISLVLAITLQIGLMT
jgi:hypothetical protein